jgi:hypothetical protein
MLLSFISTARPSLHCMALASCLLLLPLFNAHAQSSTIDVLSQDAPQTAVTAFYHWYLEALTKDRIPLQDNRRKMQSFVAVQLLKKIEQRNKKAEAAGEDYFTRAQDYFEDWESNIAVSDVIVSGKDASVVVTLGSSKESQHRMAVQLFREGDGWKISRVSEAPPLR